MQRSGDRKEGVELEGVAPGSLEAHRRVQGEERVGDRRVRGVAAHEVATKRRRSCITKTFCLVSVVIMHR